MAGEGALARKLASNRAVRELLERAGIEGIESQKDWLRRTGVRSAEEVADTLSGTVKPRPVIKATPVDTSRQRGGLLSEEDTSLARKILDGPAAPEKRPFVAPAASKGKNYNDELDISFADSTSLPSTPEISGAKVAAGTAAVGGAGYALSRAGGGGTTTPATAEPSKPGAKSTPTPPPQKQDNEDPSRDIDDEIDDATAKLQDAMEAGYSPTRAHTETAMDVLREELANLPKLDRDKYEKKMAAIEKEYQETKTRTDWAQTAQSIANSVIAIAASMQARKAGVTVDPANFIVSTDWDKRRAAARDEFRMKQGAIESVRDTEARDIKEISGQQEKLAYQNVRLAEAMDDADNKKDEKIFQAGMTANQRKIQILQRLREKLAAATEKKEVKEEKKADKRTSEMEKEDEALSKAIATSGEFTDAGSRDRRKMTGDLGLQLGKAGVPPIVVDYWILQEDPPGMDMFSDIKSRPLRESVQGYAKVYKQMQALPDNTARQRVFEAYMSLPPAKRGPFEDFLPAYIDFEEKKRASAAE